MQAKVQSQDQHQCRLEEDAAATYTPLRLLTGQVQIVANLVGNATIAKIFAKIVPTNECVLKLLHVKC